MHQTAAVVTCAPQPLSRCFLPHSTSTGSQLTSPPIKSLSILHARLPFRPPPPPVPCCYLTLFRSWLMKNRVVLLLEAEADSLRRAWLSRRAWLPICRAGGGGGSGG